VRRLGSLAWPTSAKDGFKSDNAALMIGFKILAARGEPLIKGPSGGETPLSREVSCGCGDASSGEGAFEPKNRSVVTWPTSREATVKTAVSGAGIVLVFKIGFLRGADWCSRAGTLVGSAGMSAAGEAFSSVVLSTMRPPTAAAGAFTTSDGSSDAVTSAFTASLDAALALLLFGSTVETADAIGSLATGLPAMYWFAKKEPTTVVTTESKTFRNSFDAYLSMISVFPLAKHFAVQQRRFGWHCTETVSDGLKEFRTETVGPVLRHSSPIRRLTNQSTDDAARGDEVRSFNRHFGWIDWPVARIDGFAGPGIRAVGTHVEEQTRSDFGFHIPTGFWPHDVSADGVATRFKLDS
jgi:hypothetical protein